MEKRSFRQGVKLSITLDTLTARILKLSSDSQSRIEPVPFYSWWNTTDCRADPAVAPVTHEIPRASEKKSVKSQQTVIK